MRYHSSRIWCTAGHGVGRQARNTRGCSCLTAGHGVGRQAEGKANMACNAARMTNKIEVKILEVVMAEGETRRRAKERSEELDQEAPMTRMMTMMMQAKMTKTEEETRSRNAQKGDVSSVEDQSWYIDQAAGGAISATR